MQADFSTFVAQNYSLFALLGVIIVMIAVTEFRRATAGFREITPTEATRLLSHEQAVILDVREPKEHSQGHIVDDLFVPLAELEGRMAELDRYKEQPLIVYCRSGHRSRSACAKLAKRGFTRLYNLAGGILAWENAHLPVSRK